VKLDQGAIDSAKTFSTIARSLPRSPGATGYFRSIRATSFRRRHGRLVVITQLHPITVIFSLRKTISKRSSRRWRPDP